MNPFALIDALSFTKEDLIREPDMEREYKSFLVNRSLSYHSDAIFEANTLNCFPECPNTLCFDFYKYSLAKRKRFSKWIKPEENSNLEAIMEYFKCNRIRAKEYLQILTNEDVAMIHNKINQGGVVHESNNRKSRGDKIKRTG